MLAAYFHAEHMKAFRRLLWHWLALVTVIWLVVATMTNLIPTNVWPVGLGVLGIAAVGAAVVEWRAAKRFSGLLADRATS